jgi:hypothetical protein
MADPIHNRGADLDSPFWDAATVTASASDLARIPTRGLYIGGTGGDVTVTTASNVVALY